MLLKIPVDFLLILTNSVAQKIANFTKHITRVQFSKETHLTILIFCLLHHRRPQNEIKTHEFFVLFLSGTFYSAGTAFSCGG